MDEQATVLRFGQTLPLDRGGGVRTRYLVRQELGARKFLNGITEFDAGMSLPFHSHNCDESVVVLEGEAQFETENATTILQPFDTTWVPTGVVHRFVNPGIQILRILWTYGSVDATRTLAASGETFAIGSSAELRD